MKRQLYRELLLQAPHSFQAGCLASTQKQFSHVASVLIRHRRVLRKKNTAIVFRYSGHPGLGVEWSGIVGT